MCSNYTYICEHTCSIFATWCVYTVCTAAINSYTGTVQCALLLLLYMYMYYKQLLSLLTTVFGTHTYMHLHTFVFFVRVSYHNHGVWATLRARHQPIGDEYSARCFVTQALRQAAPLRATCCALSTWAGSYPFWLVDVWASWGRSSSCRSCDCRDDTCRCQVSSVQHELLAVQWRHLSLSRRRARMYSIHVRLKRLSLNNVVELVNPNAPANACKAPRRWLNIWKTSWYSYICVTCRPLSSTMGIHVQAVNNV